MGIFVESADCDGANPTIFADLNCKVPMLQLLSDPISLSQGTLIRARVIAVNSIGESIPSILNSFGALIEMVPHKPPTAPTKNYATTQNSLVIDYLHLVGTADGGSEVLCYQVQWN